MLKKAVKNVKFCTSSTATLLDESAEKLNKKLPKNAAS
jgi:hypothetical protein